MLNSKNNLIRALVVGLTVLLFMTPPSFAAGWQWMTPQRAFSLVKEGSGLWLVDVRSETAFVEAHVEGAVNIQAGLLTIRHLPKEKIIVILDDSLGLRQGREASETLLKNGNGKVFLLEGGMQAWQGERYPTVGKGDEQIFLRVLPEDIRWAQEQRIALRIFDLRDKEELQNGTVQQALTVEGKGLVERLETVKKIITGNEKMEIITKLDKPQTNILIFPAVVDPRPYMVRSFRGKSGDFRFLEGGYAAWSARPDKSVRTVGVCSTCPQGVYGGEK